MFELVLPVFQEVTDNLKKGAHLFNVTIKLINYSAYSSTASFALPIPVSDWLVFCSRDLILHQINKWEW